jgi:hypothetical protein
MKSFTIYILHIVLLFWLNLRELKQVAKYELVEMAQNMIQL